MRQIIANSKGVTLIETVLAVAIMLFVFSGILTLFVHCTFLNETNRNLSSAMVHSQYIMEQIIDTTFYQIESNINNGNWDLDENDIESAPYDLTALKNESIDTQVFQSGNPLGVSVRVDWSDRWGRARFTTLETLATDHY
jgi:Tfp pilus assembly protein PilE